MKKMTLNSMALAVVGIFLHGQAFSGTVASVNGKIITDEDLQAMVSNIPEAQRGSLLKDPATRKQLVDSLIDQELMYQDAIAKKIESSKEYQTALNAFKKQALVNILVQKQLAPKVTPDAVKNYFNKNKLRYTGDQVHAQHILLGTEKEAQAVFEEAKKSGADFQKIAEAKSKDPSAKNNRGDLGFFSRDMFDPSFVEAAFTTKVGEVTGPVKSAFGYHVIKVVDRKIGKTTEFSEVEAKVRNDFQRETLQSYVAGLKTKASIK